MCLDVHRKSVMKTNCTILQECYSYDDLLELFFHVHSKYLNQTAEFVSNEYYEFFHQYTFLQNRIIQAVLGLEIAVSILRMCR